MSKRILRLAAFAAFIGAMGTVSVGSIAQEKFFYRFSKIEPRSAGPALTPPILAPIQNIAEPLNVNAQAAVSGGQSPFVWSLSNAPGWVSINASTGELGGTVGSSDTTFTITATDSQSVARSATVTVRAAEALSMTQAVINDDVVGQPLGVPWQAAVSGGRAPYAWSAQAKPSWVSVDPSSGHISGTPDASSAGQHTVSLRVTDVDGRVATSASTFTVHGALSLQPPTLVANLYAPIVNQALPQASGGVAPYSFAMSGAPGWLSIDPSTGRMSGTPLAQSNHALSLTVTDSRGNDASASTNLTVGPSQLPALALSAPSFSSVQTVGLPVGVQSNASASGGYGTRTFSLVDGPGWLTVNSSTGVIGGTISSAGPFSARLVVTDEGGESRDATLSGIADNPLTLTAAEVSNAMESQPITVSGQPSATGGRAPLSWSSSDKPSWLSVDSSTGALSGTPPASSRGPVSATLNVTDAVGRTQSSVVSFTVVEGLVVSAPQVAAVYPNTPISVPVQASASGGVAPYVFSLVDAPIWLKINPSTGEITGTPNSPHSYTVQLVATDANGNNRSAPFRLAFGYGPLTIDYVIMARYQDVGTALKSSFLSINGGHGDISFSVENAPAWLTINRKTGVFEGPIPSPGPISGKLVATDEVGGRAETSFSTEAEMPLAMSIPQSTTLRVNAPGSIAPTYSGGAGANTYMILDGNIRTQLSNNALSLHMTTGVISGTPAHAATYSFNIRVQDRKGRNVDFPITVQVQP